MQHSRDSSDTSIGRQEARHAKTAVPREGGITLARGEYGHRVISGAQFPHRFPPTMHGRIV